MNVDFHMMQIQWNSRSPEFREKFLFSLDDRGETETRTLAFHLYVVSPAEGNATGLRGRDADSYSLLGEALLPLKDVPLFSPYSNWLPLHDVFHQVRISSEINWISFECESDDYAPLSCRNES